MSELACEEVPGWSDRGRAAFVRAAGAAIEAYRGYVELVASSTSDADRERIDVAKWPVARAFLEAHQAEIMHAGTLGPSERTLTPWSRTSAPTTAVSRW